MAGLNWEVSPMTVDSGAYTACANAVRKAGYWVLVRRYYPSGEYDTAPQYIPDRASKECRYDKSHEDPKCLAANCKSVGLGKQYADDIIRRGT